MSLAHTMSQPILQTAHLACGYNNTPLFENIDLAIEKGQCIALVGPSGSGKTTLLKTLLGILKPLDGHIYHYTQRDRISYVPQLEMIDWQFPVTVEQVVLMGTTPTGFSLPWTHAAVKQKAKHILGQLGIADLQHRHISKLSGGQQQRVFLARALINDPELLVLDEPIQGVDIKTRDAILHILKNLNQQGMTIIMTAHDLNIVGTHIPWVICFNKKIIAQGPTDSVYTNDILSATYESPLQVITYQHGSQTLKLVAEQPHIHEKLP